MNDLVDDVLSYSKSQRADLEMQTFNLADAIKVVESDIESLPDIAIGISFSKMPDVNADIAGVKEVLFNFITNAYKYNDSETKKIKFEFDNETKKLLITDNGIGIKKEDQGKVFSFFKRIHGKNEYGGGSGAGLAIVKKILERQGISIEIESEVRKGTTFKLDLNEVLVVPK